MLRALPVLWSACTLPRSSARLWSALHTAPLLRCRYEVRVPKEETDMVGDLRYSWRKLKKLALEVSDTLSRLQVVEGCLA